MKILNEKINLYSDKIKKDYIFCLMADIHNTKYSSLNFWINLIEEIKKQNPDAIFIAGDLIYSADDLNEQITLNKLDFLLKELGKIAPVYICLGNHDLKNGKLKNALNTINYLESLEDFGVFLLKNKSLLFDENLILAGFSPIYNSYYVKYRDKWEDYFIEDLLKSDFEFNEKSFVILLTHSPEIISSLELYITKKIDESKSPLENSAKLKLEKVLKILNKLDLILCGHTHDGLIPRYLQKFIKSDKGFVASEGEKFGEARLRWLPYCRGVHDVFFGKLIVTRGVNKWCKPTLLFSLINKRCAKDITTIKLIKKIEI